MQPHQFSLPLPEAWQHSFQIQSPERRGQWVKPMSYHCGQRVGRRHQPTSSLMVGGRGLCSVSVSPPVKEGYSDVGPQCGPQTPGEPLIMTLGARSCQCSVDHAVRVMVSLTGLRSPEGRSLLGPGQHSTCALSNIWRWHFLSVSHGPGFLNVTIFGARLTDSSTISVLTLQ